MIINTTATSLALQEVHKNHIFFSPLRKKSIFTEDLSAEDHVTERI